MKKFFFIVMVLMLLPTVFASSICSSGENCTIWASVFNGTQYFNASDANVYIRDSTGNNVVYNESMDNNGSGVFRYIFISNNTGNYYVQVEYFSGSTLLLQADSSLYIQLSEEEKMLGLAIILGLIGLAFVIIYASSQIKTQEIPKGRVPEKMTFYALFLGVIITIAGVLYVYVHQSISYTVLQIPFTTLFIVLVLCVAAIVGFYLVYLIEVVWRQKKELDEDD